MCIAEIRTIRQTWLHDLQSSTVRQWVPSCIPSKGEEGYSEGQTPSPLAGLLPPRPDRTASEYVRPKQVSVLTSKNHYAYTFRPQPGERKASPGHSPNISPPACTTGNRPPSGCPWVIYNYTSALLQLPCLLPKVPVTPTGSVQEQ